MRRLSKSCSSWLFVHLILKKPYATCVKLGSSCSFATFSGGLWEPKKHTSFNQEIDPFRKIQESNVYVQEATLSSISWISWISASEEKKHKSTNTTWWNIRLTSARLRCPTHCPLGGRVCEVQSEKSIHPPRDTQNSWRRGWIYGAPVTAEFGIFFKRKKKKYKNSKWLSKRIVTSNDLVILGCNS